MLKGGGIYMTKQKGHCQEISKNIFDFILCPLILLHSLDNILSGRKDEQGKKSVISIEAIPGIYL